MKNMKRYGLVLALALGFMGARLLGADPTVRSETVVWDFVNGVKAGGVSLASTVAGVLGLGGSSLTGVTITGSTGVLSVNARGAILTMPAVQVVAATETIAADACGGVKRISAASAITTSTTDTFTAPAAANAGCHMVVCNVDDTDTITLDVNTNFKALGGANIALTAFDCTQVFSDGTFWYSAGSLVAN